MTIQTKFSKEEAKHLFDEILFRCSTAHSRNGGTGQQAAEVIVMHGDSALTRFANNAIHQNVAERDTNVMVRFLLGKKLGTASTNRLDSRGLDDVVDQAKFNARVSPEDPAYPGLSEPAEYTPVSSFDVATAEFSAEDRARAVGIVCQLAAARDLNASGAFTTGSSVLAIANSQGVFAYHESTRTDFQTVVMSDDSSGRAHGSGWSIGQIKPETLARQAINKAERGRKPRQIEAGEYPVILDHYAAQDILQMLNFSGMGAQSVLEGRSWMAERIDQQLMHPSVSIWDDGLDLHGSPMPFDYEGVPKKRVDIVRDGVVLGPVYDRYTAQKAGKQSTGHSLPPTARGFGPIATNLFMKGGDGDVETMIASTKQGLYITRFWYTRPVHPRDCVITGMTRDGVFMVLDGEIAFPVKNLRFTQSYVEALANVVSIGKETHLLVGEMGGIAIRVPALKIEKFNFTGTTS